MPISSKKQTKSFILIVFILISMFSCNNSIQDVTSNPIYYEYLTYGALLPQNYSHGIIMQTADVIIDIDAEKLYRYATIGYLGNYTFYNTNETQSLMIAAPFTSYTSNLSMVEEKTSVTVDGVQSNFSIIVIEQTEENYTSYLLNWFYVNLILCNITFQTNTTTNVIYEFISVQTSIGYDTTHIDYIVGTANSWENSSNIYEEVEFRVTGFQPKKHSDNCKVSRIPNGKSYLWKWENEKIEVPAVGITYYNRQMHPVIQIIILATTIPIMITIITVVTIKLVKRHRKRNL